MAANINLTYPNFTLTPQAGTFGTINTEEATTRLRIKNTAGGLINDYTLSANITGEIVAVEYCGPQNLSGFIDDVTFFTIERLNSTTCSIKRWEINVNFSLLNLKQEIIKQTTGNFYYDVRAGAVEYYQRSFDFSQPGGFTYLDMNNASKVESGGTLFLGPSTDSDNPGATEKVSVSSVDGNRVHLNGRTVYEYVFGDPITFFNNVYIVSEKGYGGDVRTGTMFKLDAYSGNRLDYTTSGEYTRITGARWSTSVGSVACISSQQLMFIRPYDGYLKWKSMFLNNIDDANVDSFPVYDVVFDGFNMYKLAKKATTKDDTGDKTTETWPDYYNYQQDTLLPYTHNIAVYMKQQHTSGYDDVTRIYVQTRDQFGVGLRDVNVKGFHDGTDPGAVFEPLNGQAVTDLNGEADIGYTVGGLYTGPSTVSVRADKSSTFTGSEYCWNFILIDGKVEITKPMGGGAVFQDKQQSGFVDGRQVYDPYKVYYYDKEEKGYRINVPPIYIKAISYFTAPGGGWVGRPVGDDDKVDECWPQFQRTPNRLDGPNGDLKNTACGWECITWPAGGPSDPVGSSLCDPQDPGQRPYFITQVSTVTQFGVSPRYYLTGGDLDNDARALRIKQPTDYWQYHDIECADRCELGDGEVTRHSLFQLDAGNELMFSQLNLSKHSHWVDGSYTDVLETNVRLDQFIFVEDAVPSFWSSKNPRGTDIWIRMRPFAFSLNGDTLKFYVREVYTVDDKRYDTGYRDVVQEYGWPPNNDRVTLDYFDAGGGVLGIEFTYDNPDIYHHDSIVYIHIELEDTAAEPNFIYTDYWFRVIPDFKSPYLINENPGREEDQVALDTNLYFEIKDDGEGIDIDTLEVYLNSRLIYNPGLPQNPSTVIEMVDITHYKVTIDLPYELQYGKSYSIAVRVTDVSENRNRLRDSYRIYTRYSDVPWFTDFDPALCKRGMPKFRDVSFLVLGGGAGVDPQTIRLQVHDKDVTDKSRIAPVIYRIA